MPIGQRVQRGIQSLLPRGPFDALLQLSLFVAADLGYESVRGIVDGKTEQAFANAHAIIGLEQGLGLFFEPRVQSLALDHRWSIELANWAYMNSHFVVTTAFLVWLYLVRNGSFYFIRNVFMVAMGLALVGYLLVPTAPPRMLPGFGFVDTIADIGNVNSDSALVRTFINPYAAVPSMHMAFSLMVAVPAVILVRKWLLRVLWSLYPLLVLTVIVVTANHYWFDAALGALVAAVAALTAQRVLSRARPSAWAWRDTETKEATI